MNKIDYPGSASQFRAFMDVLTNSLDRGIWHPEQAESLRIGYDSSLGAESREGWIIIKVGSENCYATILAYEVMANTTIVHIYDGILFHASSDRPDWSQTAIHTASLHQINHQPIGKPLEMFLDELTSRIAKQLTPRLLAPKRPDTRNLDDWFDYYYECQRVGIKTTLKDISKEASYNYDYVRQQHSKYKDVHNH